MNLQPLLPYLPSAEVLPLLDKWLKDEAFELAVNKPRTTKLGDFRPPRKGARAKITLNRNLGKYQFLTTLVHEIAHLKVWNAYGRKAAPHGIEWKTLFGKMLIEMVENCAFPAEYRTALMNHATKPKSAVGGDLQLQKVVLQLDSNKEVLLLDDLKIGTTFNFKGRHFKKLEKRRTRALVEEVRSKKQYTIPLVAQVDTVQ
ncbi:MAG TPA: sprT domain-containing protein [Cryomorphaceae bacterium]|mgnify:CR=1 FL=1|nr:sprT domain-containing protein [Cryomorphaceae bacterium]|tara:strand:- start:5329 stop:5931 length:603 start_codon:yes stop_codon:yes gene_type:complete